MKLLERYKDKKGLALAIWIELLLVFILLILLLTPLCMNLHQFFLEDAEKRHEETAYDSLIMEYAADGEDFEAIYDAVNKRFVDPGHVSEVKPYGRSKKNKGKLLYVTIDSEGNIKETWVLPEYFDKRDL